MFNKKYREAILADEEMKALDGMMEDDRKETFRIKKVNANPTPNQIMNVNMKASYDQRMYLKEIMDNLESFGLRVLIPKKTDNLLKGECFDLIRKMLKKQREIEVAMVK